MTETKTTIEAPPAPAPATPKKGKAKKPADKKVPPASVLVIEAVTKLNEKSGSSLLAIKKFISENHKDVDVARLAPFIKKALSKAVEKGTLLQPKGTGAAGSFKLAVKPKAVKKPAGQKKLKVKKPKAAKESKPKKPIAKKAAKAKSPKAVSSSPKKAGVKAKAPKAPSPKKVVAKPKPGKKPAAAPEKKVKAVKAGKPKGVKTKLPKKVMPAAKPRAGKKPAAVKKAAAAK
ncbi:unnamed protein product [Allacma fusca]|uniref:H15 domain-containing protein n=1 Tax=Allacma fusca TaxID=39272 RepID=A0A8J2KEA0_9HEXA|nr:unnamed protein product [Allacma fusca]